MIDNKRTLALLKNRISKLDKPLLAIVYTLVFISTLFVYSATRSMSYVRNNLLWIGIGTLILFVIALTDYRASKRFINGIYIFYFNIDLYKIFRSY